jgi:branched-chain amino acid transport system substrate-binding protein
LQGQEGLNALLLWADYIQQAGGMAVGPSGPRLPLRLVALDDGSRAGRARENVLRLLTEDRVDLLLGPYSSGLTRAVAPLAEGHGKILWNHGGSSDAIPDEGWRHVVSVPSPASDYLRALPLLVKREDPTVTRMSVVHAGTGTFAAHVARGVTEAARASAFDVVRLIPFESPLRDARPLLADALAGEPDLLVGVGRFQDDVTMVRRRDLLGGIKRLAFVGAGLEAFHEEVGDLAEDVIGPSQWEPAVHDPPRTGPSGKWFSSEFEKRFHRRPGYPAAQAFALGMVIMECLRRAGSLEDEALLSAARGLDTTTLYGRFSLDPMTSHQIGHRVLLVQWRNGRKVVISG